MKLKSKGEIKAKIEELVSTINAKNESEEREMLLCDLMEYVTYAFTQQRLYYKLVMYIDENGTDKIKITSVRPIPSRAATLEETIEQEIKS